MSVRSVQNMTLYGAGVSSSLAPSSDLVGDFEPIATVTVGSGGASSIEFTSIPGTYQHLQIRFIGRCDEAAFGNYARIQVNGDTGNNYAHHHVYGTGTSALASATTSTAQIIAYRIPGASHSANIFGAVVLDLLDYASTSKTKTLRYFGGLDGNTNNTQGQVWVGSGLWNSTSAVTSVKLQPSVSVNWVQFTTAALYGVRA